MDMAKPKIRFKGYTDDWEQRKLGDVFEQTLNLVNPKEDEIELWSLTVEDGLTKKSDRYNREFLVKKDDNFKEVRPGDIVYNPMNMTLGAVGYNGMAKSVAVSGYYTTMVAKENYDTYYINTWLKIPQAIRLYRTYATGSLIEKQRVQFPTLSIIPVTFPKYEEQIKIGSYFHSLDNLITLHQRKCEETKKIKKYMLQKMFPQNGQTVPEIRFAGFTDAWEQRKLGEVFREYSKKGHTELPTLTIIQGGGTVKREDSDRNLMYDEANLSNYKMVRKDDFIVHLRSFEGGLEKSSLDGIISPAYHTFHSDEADSRFYYTYFRSFEFIKHKLVPHVYGIRDGRSIDIEGMKSIEIPYTSLSEQRIIGDYLELLDHLITLHQRKNIYFFLSLRMFGNSVS